MWPLILALNRQRHVDFGEFKASRIHRMSFRTARGYIVRPWVKNKNKTEQTPVIINSSEGNGGL